MGCLHQIFPFWTPGTLWKRKKKVCTRQKDGEWTKQGPLKQQNQSTYELTETEAVGPTPTWVCTRFFAYVFSSLMSFCDSWMWESGFQIPESFLGFFYPLSLVSSNSNKLVFYFILLLLLRRLLVFLWETERE